MLRPSGWAWIAVTSAPASRSACGPASEAAPSAQSMTTRRPASGWSMVRTRWATYSSTAVGWAVTRPTPAPVGRCHVLPHPLLDGRLDGVVELVPAAGQELDAVVGHRVVRGGQHDAEVGAEAVGEVGDARGRQHAEQQHVDPGRGQPGDDRGLEELPGDAGVATDHGQRPVARRTRRGRRARGRRPRTGRGPARRSAHRWPGPGPRRCRRVAARSLGSALAVLRRLPGLLQTGLLALDDAGVTGQQPGLLQRRRGWPRCRWR